MERKIRIQIFGHPTVKEIEAFDGWEKLCGRRYQGGNGQWCCFLPHQWLETGEPECNSSEKCGRGGARMGYINFEKHPEIAQYLSAAPKESGESGRRIRRPKSKTT